MWLANRARPRALPVAALAEIAFIERTLPVDLLPNSCSIHCRPATLPPAEQQATFHGLSRRYGIRSDRGRRQLASNAARLRQLQPDLLISARFSHIFKLAAGDSCHGIVAMHRANCRATRAGLFAPMRSMLLEDATELMHGALDRRRHRHRADRRRTPAAAAGSQHGLVGQINQLYCLAIPTLLGGKSRRWQTGVTAGRPVDASTRCYRSLPGADEMAQFAASGVLLEA